MSDKTYAISEVFWSIQGEGARTGTPTAFLRFAGCNLRCPECDTDHSVRCVLTAREIAEQVADVSLNGNLVITGGEPLLQLDLPLLYHLRRAGISYIALETNGSMPVSVEMREMLSWITVSPKRSLKNLAIKVGEELKVLFPEYMTEELRFSVDNAIHFDYYFVQPCFCAAYECYLQQALEFVLENPRWRIGLQIHKIVGGR